MEWAAKNFDFVLQLSLTHVLISLVPLFLGSVFAFALVRLTPPKLAGTIGTTFSAIYAIPSLAIFVALPAVIGTSYLGPTNVVIALSVYVAASMFFSTRDAFNQVPQPTVFIARAQGLSPFQLFVHVELPLAIPGLIAGLRVAAACPAYPDGYYPDAVLVLSRDNEKKELSNAAKQLPITSASDCC